MVVWDFLSACISEMGATDPPREDHVKPNKKVKIRSIDEEFKLLAIYPDDAGNLCIDIAYEDDE